MATENRFLAKVDKDGPVPECRPDLGPCWLWTAAKDGDGYGRFQLDGRNQRAHRVSFEMLVGPIPEGLHIDHLCRVRHCVNPDHLEPVTRRVNVLRGEGPSALHARKTHCPQGHPYSGENLYVYRDGRRYCRACHREAVRRYEAKRRAA